jgi:hypothetical protein
MRNEIVLFTIYSIATFTGKWKGGTLKILDNVIVLIVNSVEDEAGVHKLFQCFSFSVVCNGERHIPVKWSERRTY